MLPISPTSHAQLVYPIGDDLFDSVTCCTTVVPNIPMVTSGVFLGNQTGQYGEFDRCALLKNTPVDFSVFLFPHPGGIPAMMGPPTAGLPACDEFVVLITVNDTAGLPFTTIGAAPGSSAKRNHFTLAKLVRTWIALGPNGTTLYRYWRYMLEGDGTSFAPTPAILSSSIPACFSTTPVGGTSFDRVVFRGYLDIMRPVDQNEDFIDPVDGQAFTLVMSHYDGCLEHINFPLVNSRAIATAIPSKHIGRSYQFVSPNNFSWLNSLPSASQLDLANVSHDSLRSTVSHTTQLSPTFGQSPGPLCLAEMPLVVLGTTDNPVCNCGSPSGSVADFNQSYLAPANFGTCVTQQPWNTFVMTPEIPTGFTQTYLGIWTQFARPDLIFVETTFAIGTIKYADHCARQNSYATSDEHLVWGNASRWQNLMVANIPTISKMGEPPTQTDYMLHFGNHVDETDNFIVGEPAYVNVIWNTYR